MFNRYICTLPGYSFFCVEAQDLIISAWKKDSSWEKWLTQLPVKCYLCLHRQNIPSYTTLVWVAHNLKGGKYCFTLHLVLITSNLDPIWMCPRQWQPTNRDQQKKIGKYRSTTWIATILNNHSVWKYCYSLGPSVYSFCLNTDVELWLLMFRLGFRGSL